MRNRITQYINYQPPRVVGGSEDFQEALANQNNSAACAIAYDKGYDAGKDEGREEMRIILNKHHRAAIQTLEHRLQQTCEDSFAAGVVVTVAAMLCVMVGIAYWRM